jgi:hypothetical protein
VEDAARILIDRGLSVTRRDDELSVRWDDAPELRVVLVQDRYVRDEAEEIGAGSPHADRMRSCDVRFEILIDDLDEVLDEINTLIEVQATLQNATDGFLFNTWNGHLSPPDG